MRASEADRPDGPALAIGSVFASVAERSRSSGIAPPRLLRERDVTQVPCLFENATDFACGGAVVGVDPLEGLLLE